MPIRLDDLMDAVRRGGSMGTLRVAKVRFMLLDI